MKRMCLRTAVLTLLILVAFCGSMSSAADDKYPESPIKHIVPLSPGGSTDTLVRIIAPYWEEEMGATIVIENMTGAGTQVALTALMAAPADGYVIGSANQPHLSFTVALQNASYEESDFAWLNMQQIDHSTYSVLPDKPWKNFQDLIDDIKAHPGEIAFGTVQMSGEHIFLLYLQKERDLDFIIVPYKGGAESRAALLGGHVDVSIDSAFAATTMRDHIRSIGVGSEARSTLWPDAPTVYEATGDRELADVAIALSSFRGIVVPKKFKNDYPQRYEKLLQALKNAYHSEGHLADAEKSGLLSIMHWTGPEEAERLSRQANEAVAKYSKYFFEK